MNDKEHIQEDDYTDVNVLLEMLTDINDIFNDYLPCFYCDRIRTRVWAWSNETEAYFLEMVEKMQEVSE